MFKISVKVLTKFARSDDTDENLLERSLFDPRRHFWISSSEQDVHRHLDKG